MADPLVIANGNGQTVRLAMNSAVMLIATCFSSSTAPSTPHPGLIWADSGTGKLWQRKQDNNGWNLLGTLDSPNLGLVPLSMLGTANAANVVAQCNASGQLAFNITGSAASAGSATSAGTATSATTATTANNIPTSDVGGNIWIS